MKTKRAGLFLIIAGLIWFAMAIVLVHAPWAMGFRSSFNRVLRYVTPDALPWYDFARFVFFEALYFGYKHALAVIIAGIGVLLL